MSRILMGKILFTEVISPSYISFGRLERKWRRRRDLRWGRRERQCWGGFRSKKLR